MASGKLLFKVFNFNDLFLCYIEVLGVPPQYVWDKAPCRDQYFDGSGIPRNERIFSGSYPLNEVLATCDPTLVDFVSSCLRWHPAERLTPEQALAHSWLQEPGSAISRTTTTTITTTMTTAAITTTTTMLLSPLAVTSEEQEDKEMVEQEMEAVEQETELVCKRKKKRSHLDRASRAIGLFFCRVLLCIQT
ncbi:unnamed protein product [Lampetra fluviatilis]